MSYKIDDLVSVRGRPGFYYVWYIKSSSRGPLHFIKSAATHKVLEGGFYQHELTNMREDDWCIEKVVSIRYNMRNKKEVLVKWFDLHSTFNKWIPAKDMNKY